MPYPNRESRTVPQSTPGSKNGHAAAAARPPATALPSPPSAADLRRAARALATTPPGTNVADALGVAPEIARVWESMGHAELQRAAAAGDGVRPELGAFVAIARMSAGLDALGTGADEQVGIAGGQLTLRHPVSEAICDAVAEGMSLSGAANAAGVTPRTATSWRQRGRAVQQRVEAGDVEWDDLDPREKAVMAFAIRVGRAESVAEAAAVRVIREAARGARNADGSLATDESGRLVRPPDWRAAMTWLVLRRGSSWRRTQAKDDGAAERQGEAPRGQPLQIVVHRPAPGPA